MKKLAPIFLLAFFVSGPAMAAPSTWQIVPAKSTITFTATEQGGSFEGKFPSFSGEIVFDENDLAASHAKILIDTGSVVTGSPDRDTELPKAEWFNSGVFPKAQFETTAFRKDGTGFVADGKLTIRNKERPVSLPFTLTVTKDEKSGTRTAVATGGLTLNRLDYDVGTGQWKDTSSVGGDVGVKISITATASAK